MYSLSGKAPRCEREEQGLSPGAHLKRNIVQLDRTLGYEPKDASSSLAILTNFLKQCITNSFNYYGNSLYYYQKKNEHYEAFDY